MKYLDTVKELLKKFNADMRYLPDNVKRENPQWTERAIAEEVVKKRKEKIAQYQTQIQKIATDVEQEYKRLSLDVDKIRFPLLNSSDSFSLTLGEMQSGNAMRFLAMNNLPKVRIEAIKKTFDTKRRDFASTLIDSIRSNIQNSDQSIEGQNIIRQLDEIENSDTKISALKNSFGELGEMRKIVTEFNEYLKAGSNKIQLNSLFKFMSDAEIKENISAYHAIN